MICMNKLPSPHSNLVFDCFGAAVGGGECVRTLPDLQSPDMI